MFHYKRIKIGLFTDVKLSQENEFFPHADVGHNVQNDFTEKSMQKKCNNSQYWTKEDVEPPPFLIAKETLAFAAHNSDTIDIFDLKSKFQLTSESNTGNINSDLDSPEDPFATDGENDPDYSPNDNEEYSTDEGDHEINNQDKTDSGDTTDKIKSKTRKNKKCVNQWRRNVIKKLRNEGKSYKNWSNKIVQKRQLKAPCQNCRMKCYEKFSDEERRQIFDQYWKLGNIDRQRDFISKLVDFTQKKRQRIREIQGQHDRVESRRNLTFHYHLQKLNGVKIKICKTFFFNSLGISSQVVKTVANKLKNNVTIEKDKRGKVCLNSKLPDEVKQAVRDHINSFQPIESHYCRQNTGKVYLPASLNISKMYSLYREYCAENNIAQVSSAAIYRQVF